MTSNEEKICNDIKKRIQYQLNHNWGGILDSSQKDKFLRNFSPEDEIVGYVLLDMLLLHNQEQEKQLTKVLIHKLYSSIYKKIQSDQSQSSMEIETIISKEMKNACFIPVADKNCADSSNAWTSIFRDQVGNSDCFYDVDKIPLLLAIKKRYIIFYDDMLGSGTQFDLFLSKARYCLNDKKQLSLWELLSNCNQKVYYLCIAGYKEGIDKIKKEYHRIEIIEAEFFEDDDNILSRSNEYWEYYDDEFKDYMIKKVKNILKEHEVEEPYTRNLPVIFERNRPSNTVFPLYWLKSEKWNPIKAREGI